MATEDDAPLTWDSKALDRVKLDGADEDEKRGWVRSYAIRHGMDESDLPWNLR